MLRRSGEGCATLRSLDRLVGCFEDGYVSEDGAEHRRRSPAVWAVPLELGMPVRRFTSRKGPHGTSSHRNCNLGLNKTRLNRPDLPCEPGHDRVFTSNPLWIDRKVRLQSGVNPTARPWTRSDFHDR